jgi:hypothetical protein
MRRAGMEADSGSGGQVLARVRTWEPGSDPLREVRERLLGLGVEELRELMRVLRGN